MSDTTPRPDETPGDPTAPRPPESVSRRRPRRRARSRAAYPQPACAAPACTAPAAQPQYAQPGYAPAAAPGLPAARHGRRRPEPDVADRGAHHGHGRRTAWPSRRPCSRAVSSGSSRRW